MRWLATLLALSLLSNAALCWWAWTSAHVMRDQPRGWASDWYAPVPDDWPAPRTESGFHGVAIRGVEQSAHLGREGGSSRDWSLPGPGCFLARCDMGWPASATRIAVRWKASDLQMLTGSRVSERQSLDHIGSPSLLWTGAIINLAVHAALWCILIYAVTGIRKRWRRAGSHAHRALFIAACVISGACLTVITSWLVWNDAPESPLKFADDLPRSLEPIQYLQDVPDPGPLWFSVVAPAEHAARNPWPCATVLVLSTMNWDRDEHFSVSIGRVGWPFHAMQSKHAFQGGLVATPTHGNIWISGLPTPKPLRDRGFSTRLAIRPAWPGFALNTLFYAILTALAITATTRAFTDVRTWHRTRRGRCPACGYDIAGVTTCPECGAEG